jgi:hypothetical protein
MASGRSNDHLPLQFISSSFFSFLYGASARLRAMASSLPGFPEK